METDILIIGSGPAGLQAAIHAARRKVKTVVCGRVEGSALSGAKIENMVGVRAGTAGDEVLSDARKLAEGAGAKFVAADVIQIKKTDGGFSSQTEDGTTINCDAVIFALGVKRKTLKIDGLDKYLGKGLSYCADCDAGFYKGKEVAVVGDHSAAASGAAVLKKYAKGVTVISQKPAFSQTQRDELQSLGIKLIEGRRVKSIQGTDKVEGITLDDGTELKVDGLFIEMGSKGTMELATQINLIPDTEGHIPVDRKMATSVPGVFACGDVTGEPWQASKATGEGCTAGLSAAEYVKARKKAAPGADSGAQGAWISEFKPGLDEIKRMLDENKVIAVVGLSPDEDSPSYRLAHYLMQRGFTIIPVNPKYQNLLGVRSYPSITEIPESIKVDIVDIFRKPEAVDGIVDEAIRRKVRIVWLQEGVINEPAARKAKDAGLIAVMDMCIYKEHKRLAEQPRQ